MNIKKPVLLLFFFVLSNNLLGQTNESVQRLQERKIQLLKEKKSIEDSLIVIEQKLNILLNQSVYSKSNLEFIIVEIEKEGKLRDNPDPVNGNVKLMIPNGSFVKLYKFSNGYYVAEYNKTLGYLSELYTPNSLPYVVEFKNKFVRSGSSPSINTSPTYQASPTSITSYSSTGCPSSQCWGTTKKGNRCRNRTTNCSGYCYLHGG
ncbi:hypothetical protein NF867_05845 [Solitalea sp. MAHUQ-68]|uniref:SH3 domain-containing protein n=1 Tax=Solitalea agri TaxID=2953739 RepID=A0A9X2F5R3_9SPHI|nr:hypothetical protein [Solitalea agri]MCO4292383.1 hypothetical protein [Solitalea agri]